MRRMRPLRRAPSGSSVVWWPRSRPPYPAISRSWPATDATGWRRSAWRPRREYLGGEARGVGGSKGSGSQGRLIEISTGAPDPPTPLTTRPRRPYNESVPAVLEGAGTSPASRAFATRCQTELGVGFIPSGDANTIVLSAALASTWIVSPARIGGRPPEAIAVVLCGTSVSNPLGVIDAGPVITT